MEWMNIKGNFTSGYDCLKIRDDELNNETIDDEDSPQIIVSNPDQIRPQ